MNYQHVTHPAADLARDAKALAKSVYALNADHFCTDLDAVEVLCDEHRAQEEAAEEEEEGGS